MAENAAYADTAGPNDTMTKLFDELGTEIVTPDGMLPLPSVVRVDDPPEQLAKGVDAKQ